MSDPLVVRMGYRMKFVGDLVDRRLLQEARELLMEYEERLAERNTAREVLAWMDANDFSLVPWQKKKMDELIGGDG